MSKPIFTKQMLIDADACPSQVDLFEKTFGDSVVVTIKRAEKVAALFRWGWAIRLLDAQGRAEFDRATATALAEFKRVEAAAWPEFNRARAAAWATAFIDMHKRYAQKRSKRMKFLSIFFRQPRESKTSSAKLNALHEAQDAAYWRGQYEQAQSTANARLDALIAIRNYTANQKSGTARKVHRMTLGGGS
jgi:hypothetical protein